MILAAQYYRPPFPERRYWKEDLAGMKAAGLNAVQLWVLWSWVEPEPGRFVFDDYDELVEEAGKRGLGVVLSSIAELHPPWIHRVIPDSAMIDHMGRQVISTNRGEAHQGLTPGGCTDNPEVLRRMGAFLQTVAGRYTGAANLVGWDIWNELRWNVQADGLVCFCPHTLGAFRGWLNAKYGSLDGLNAAWKRRYCDWADVIPGKLPRRPYTEMMEFEKFLQWRAAEHMRFRAEIVKAADPQHIVTAHGAQPSAHMAGDAENHAINRGNDWDLVEPLDGVGCSHFPFWFAMSDADFGVRVECTRSAAGDKTVWVSELQGGSARQGFDVRPSVEAKPQQRWVWNGFGRGAKAVIFWCWRDEFFGRESSGYGLAGRDGLADERITLMKQTGAILREHETLLEAYRPDPAKVGVLFDPNGYNLEWAQDGVAARARDSVIGYLTAFERLQIPYTVVESSHLAALAGLKALIVPFPLAVPDAAAGPIAGFVQGGGTVLVESEAGAYTEQGIYRYPAAERPLAAALGIADLGRRPLKGEDFWLTYRKEDYNLRAAVWITPLEARDADILAYDPAGNVLATSRKLGQGTVIALGTFLGKKYAEARYEGFEEFLAQLIKTADGLPDLEVRSEWPIPWRSGPAGDQRLLFITNQSDEQVVRVRGPEALFGDAKTVRELHHDAKIKLKRADGACRFKLAVGAGDFAIVRWG
jgi:beta-galactosidase